MDAARVTQSGAGEATVLQQEAGAAMATQQGARGVAKDSRAHHTRGQRVS